ncbi:MAG: hypothetical protein VX589_02305 [Myxococcota bacterium]|nr:hypothetical protein [Myxococcota bacterium]
MIRAALSAVVFIIVGVLWPNVSEAQHGTPPTKSGTDHPPNRSETQAAGGQHSSTATTGDAKSPSEEQAPSSPTVQAARTDGYVGRPEGLKPGSGLAGTIAVIPGSIVHGLGHFYLGESVTAWTLFAAEVLGIGLMIGGAYLGASSDAGRGSIELSKILSHSGLILFSGSWIADVIGSFKGTAPLANGTIARKRERLGIGYRYTDNAMMPFRHRLNARMNFTRGHFYVRPRIDLEVGLDRREVELDTGVWLLADTHIENFMALGASAKRVENRPDGWARNTVMGYVSWQLDLGRAIRTLRHFYLFSTMGYGIARYQFSDKLETVPGVFSDGNLWDEWLNLETGLGLFIVDTTYLGLSIVQTPMGNVPPGALVDAWLFSPEAEAIKLDLKYGYTTDIGIHVQGIAGDGVGIWLGLDYGL